MEVDTLVAVAGILVAVASLTGTFFIGWATVQNGKRQIENAEAKLRLDLFEKRFEQYNVIKNEFYDFFRLTELTRESLTIIFPAVDMCRFLFDEEISSDILWFMESGEHVNSLNYKLESEDITQEEYEPLLYEKQKLISDLYNEAPNVYKRMWVYLQISPSNDRILKRRQ